MTHEIVEGGPGLGCYYGIVHLQHRISFNDCQNQKQTNKKNQKQIFYLKLLEIVGKIRRHYRFVTEGTVPTKIVRCATILRCNYLDKSNHVNKLCTEQILATQISPSSFLYWEVT